MDFRAEAAIREIAKREGMSEEEVLSAMQEALDAGRRNPDPAVQAEWRRIPCEGDWPTPVEVIAYIADKLERERWN